MKRSVLTALLLLSGSLGCGAAAAQERASALPPPWQATAAAAPAAIVPAPAYAPSWDPDATLANAAAQAAPGPRRVLDTAQAMLNEGAVVRGSCFDWVEAVYTRAIGQSHDVFHASREHGPYADASAFTPGDWIFFINHGNGDDTHSAIFIGWVDEGARTALMVSYAGGHRDEPGRYGEYELTSAYRIVRMEDDVPPPHVAHHVARRVTRP